MLFTARRVALQVLADEVSAVDYFVQRLGGAGTCTEARDGQHGAG
jgi:hypothetical protein